MSKLSNKVKLIDWKWAKLVILSSKSKCSVQAVGMKLRQAVLKPGILPKVVKYCFRKSQKFSTCSD